MRTEPIVPAEIDFERGGAPHALAFGDRDHSEAGAQDQARHVFLAGNGLPGRWAGQRRFVVLETGFGLGHNFLSTWQAWRDDPQAAGQLVFVSVELHPPTRADLQRAHRDSALPALAQQLIDAWPPLTPNLHLLDFEAGRVRLLMALGDARRWLRQLRLRADAIYLDGFAPRSNPAMWDAHLLKSVGRLAAPDATAATWSVATDLRAGLTAAGFVPALAPGLPPQREMTVARHAPRAPARRGALGAGPPASREALVIGAGIAGACAAAALARQGWACTVLDAAPEPAAGASGNPAALFHGTVHADDGLHARFTRAAALHAHRVHAGLIAQGVAGRADGLLRAHAGPDPGGWPADWAQRLDGTALQRRAPGLRADSGWWFPGGGWIDAAAAVRALLRTPGVAFRGGIAVHAIERQAGGWTVRDAAGAVCARAPVLVLAMARGTASPDAARLLDGAGGVPWPAERSRGQVTWFDSPAALPVPLAGTGYAVGWPLGQVLCGATSERVDEADGDPLPSDANHRFNLDRLRALAGIEPGAAATLRGRVGWRETTADRLPVIGPAPARPLPTAAPAHHGRHVARVPGLFVLGAMAGRGFSWGPLAGEVLAAMIDGAPLPLEADLLDAVDPARWLVRRARRGGSDSTDALA